MVVSINIFTRHEGDNSETACGNFHSWKLLQRFRKETSKGNYKLVIQHIALNAIHVSICESHLSPGMNKASLWKLLLCLCFHSYQTGHYWQCLRELVGLKTYSSVFKILYLKLKTILWSNYFQSLQYHSYLSLLYEIDFLFVVWNLYKRL